MLEIQPSAYRSVYTHLFLRSFFASSSHLVYTVAHFPSLLVRAARRLQYGPALRLHIRAMTTAPPITVPEGFTLHTENSAHILLPATQDAFLNPVQEFNRDLSVACIRAWSEEMNVEKEAKWRKIADRRPKGRKRAKR